MNAHPLVNHHPENPVPLLSSAMQDLHQLVESLGQQRIADISHEDARRYFILSSIRSRMVLVEGSLS